MQNISSSTQTSRPPFLAVQRGQWAAEKLKPWDTKKISAMRNKPQNTFPNQTKDGIYRNRMTTHSPTGASPPLPARFRVPKHSTFAFPSSAAANRGGCLGILLQPLALRSDAGPEKMMLVLALGRLKGGRGR